MLLGFKCTWSTICRYSQLCTPPLSFLLADVSVAVGGSHSNNIHQVQWGCSNKAARLSCPLLSSPPLPSPPLPSLHWDLPSSDSVDLAHYCLENVPACGAPASVERRRDGTVYLRGRIIAMKESSDQPAPCAPGCHGPPAYCDSLHFASSWRTLQLTLGQCQSDHCSPVNDSTVFFSTLAKGDCVKLGHAVSAKFTHALFDHSSSFSCRVRVHRSGSLKLVVVFMTAVSICRCF